jgi:superfamily I DNA and/or RNA helicase
MEGYGVELADCGASELAEWATLLLGEGEAAQKCKELLTLQERWLLRLGRSSDFHAAMLASANVVAGTCIGMAGVRGANSISYDLCIIDEASKATVTEILVPMARSKKWILVGDPEQLPPFFEEQAAEEMDEFEDEEARKTLLDRFLSALPATCIEELRNQYRMVKPIGDLISQTFYGNALVSPVTKPRIVLTAVYPKPVTWLSTSRLRDRREEREGLSFRNQRECMVVREVLKHVDFVARSRKNSVDLAVIAGYAGQVRSIEDAIREFRHEWMQLKVSCNTVDAFQGEEVDVCVYSVTRSNDDGKLGFLREKPRLNVALSRGKSALIVIGDEAFCREAAGAEYFQRVLRFIDENPNVCELRTLQ